jgi:hypothetical protein
LHQPLLTFETLRSVGYTECRHPRLKVNTAGDLHAHLTLCMDCGARDGADGSLDFQRLAWPDPQP